MSFKAEKTFNGYTITYDGEALFKLAGEMDTYATAEHIVKQLNKVVVE